MDWLLAQRIVALIFGLIFLAFGIFFLVIGVNSSAHRKFLEWRVARMRNDVFRWVDVLIYVPALAVLYWLLDFTTAKNPVALLPRLRYDLLGYLLIGVIYGLVQRWIPGPDVEIESWLNSDRKPVSLFNIVLGITVSFAISISFIGKAVYGPEKVNSLMGWMESGTFTGVIIVVFASWLLIRFFRWVLCGPDA